MLHYIFALPQRKHPWDISPVWWIALLFFLSGLAFLRKTGIHFDASYELASFYKCCTPAFRPSVFGQPVPVMILPYLGALKAWLYYPLLRYLEVTPTVLRLPVLLVGTVSVVLFFALLDRTIGRRGAIAGALLLETDAVFLIATTYDFGPVALLHCFLLAGLVLLAGFERKPDTWRLALAFFIFGLALWNKALFVWMFNGTVVAAAIVFPRRIWSLVTPKRVLVAAGAMILGALPLIYYNVQTGGETLRTRDVMSANAPLSQKVLMLGKTMSGNVLFGWMTEEAQPKTNAVPTKAAARISVAIGRLFHGRMRWNLLFYAFLASCCLLPWLWFSKYRTAALFVAIYLAVTWAQMIVLPNTGATMHHVLLLWPFPHFLMAIAIARTADGLGRRGPWIANSVLAVLLCSNLLLENQYYADLMTRGTTAIWTDAIYPLSTYLDSLGRRAIVTDWGYSTTLCLLSDGAIPYMDISYQLLGQPDPTWLRSLMDDPRNVFVEHAAGSVQFTLAQDHFEAVAAAAHRSRQVLSVIRDRNQRPRFEIVRYPGAP